MTSHIKILPYHMASLSAKELARGLGTLRLRRRNSSYLPSAGHTLVNWGCASAPEFNYRQCGKVLNDFDAVNTASHKLRALRAMQAAGVAVPEFTTDAATANSWECLFFGRKLIRSHSGRGILEFSPACPAPLEGPDVCPLYTKYQRKTREYRVHVMPDDTIILNQKRRKRSVPDSGVNWRVRNSAGGFVFCRNNVDPCPEAEELGRHAVRALGLDFGAADIIYHEEDNALLVLEVNTAPGLEGSLLQQYIDVFAGV